MPWELELCSNKSVTYRLEHKLYTDKQVTYWWELEFCTNAPITFWELKLCPFKPVTYWELKLCNNKLVTYWSRPVPWNLTITFGCRSTSHNKFNCLRLNVCQVVFFLIAENDIFCINVDENGLNSDDYILPPVHLFKLYKVKR